MKRFLFTASSLLLTTLAIAQNAEPVLARVKYNFIHVRDTNKRSTPYTERMLLMMSKNSSWYTSEIRLKEKVAVMQRDNELIRNNGGVTDGVVFRAQKKTPTSMYDIYFFRTTNKINVGEWMVNFFYTEEDIPHINWQLTKDTASFSGLNCQKATAFFKGRNWTAWFAPSIPLPSGPWKLNGLPGLIVEAYDSKKDVQFLFNGFETVNPESVDKAPKIIGQMMDISEVTAQIKLPSKSVSVKTTKEDMNRLKMAFAEDPIGFAKTQLAGTPFGKLFENKPNMPRKVVLMNNPIELPETK